MSKSENLPPVIFGTSCLGNIYEATSYPTKLAIVKACVDHAPGGVVVFDTAGKYGAGLALTSLGKCLKELNVSPDKVIISNKLAWYQTELSTPEPTFEPGVWKNIKNDAIQKISYDGIMECYEQGNELLGDYNSQMISIHDPDEYLNAAINRSDEEKRFKNILDAYDALFELKATGRATSVGVGAKNWRVIQKITAHVKLDWIMIANSLTLKSHPKELLDFVKEMHEKGVTIINSAVFNGGFLIGSDSYNYNIVDKTTKEGKAMYEWRNNFFTLCKEFKIQPAEACFNFGFNIPGITSVALSTTKPGKVKANVQMATKKIPINFWEEMDHRGLIKSISVFKK